MIFNRMLLLIIISSSVSEKLQGISGISGMQRFYLYVFIMAAIAGVAWLGAHTWGGRFWKDWK